MMKEVTTILVRHLPGELTADDQDDLLRHYGAVSIRSMGHSGRMKHCAFARFESHETAASAIKKLHQIEILGHRLNVEFAQKEYEDFEPPLLRDEPASKQQSKPSKDEDKERKEEVKKEPVRTLSEKLNAINPSFGVEYSFNSKLMYAYPAPTANILTNIVNAMACVPKFYTQVLHLMNKMNLPAPFGPLAPMPPISDNAPLPTGSDQLQMEEMEMSSSSEESELESDGEATVAAKIPSVHRLGKRSSVNVKQLIKKRLKLIPSDITASKKESASAAVRPEEVFEQAGTAIQKKMEIVVTGDSLKEDAAPAAVAEDGFGKLEARGKEKSDEASEWNEEEEDEENNMEFITSRELRRNRLSSSEMRKTSVFKNYEEGEPSSRLYVKNLAKQTDEKALRHVFGRYVNWKNDAEQLVFDVRLMTEGRMKGQAFVTLANEARAAVALADTNGYVLHDKPMVVQYARSAKLKPEAVPASTSARSRSNAK